MISKLRKLAYSMKSSLWIVIVSPAVWALHFLFSYIYTAVLCAKNGSVEVIVDIRAGIALATVISLLLVAASGYIAWIQARIHEEVMPFLDSTEEHSFRFLAVSTLMLSGLSFVAILFTALPPFIFENCI